MKLTKIEGIAPFELRYAIIEAVRLSRFKVRMLDHPTKTSIKIHEIRLKDKKPYCGNHPAACDIGARPRMGDYLEGLDWISWNDMINDVCDVLNVSTNINTSACNIRQGRLRRINYGFHYHHVLAQVGTWDKVGDPEDYVDGCGSYTDGSEGPYGTPGIYTRDFYNELERLAQ